MNFLQAIVYGIVQGLTEFLPVSSNAHLRLVPELFGWPEPGAAFTAVIQLGTIAAVLTFFWRDLSAAFGAWVRSIRGDRSSPDARLGWAVFIGTIPIIIFALLFKHQIEGPLRSLWVIASAIIIMGVVMLGAEWLGNKTRRVDGIQAKEGLTLGLWQTLALIPGVSRSGATIAGALFSNFDRASAARISFLLSVPSITAAGAYEFVKERKALTGDLLLPTMLATAISFVVGYAAIAWFIAFISKRGIAPFVAYRIALGLLLIALLSTGRLQPTRPEATGRVAIVSQTH